MSFRSCSAANLICCRQELAAGSTLSFREVSAADASGEAVAGEFVGTMCSAPGAVEASATLFPAGRWVAGGCGATSADGTGGRAPTVTVGTAGGDACSPPDVAAGENTDVAGRAAHVSNVRSTRGVATRGAPGAAGDGGVPLPPGATTRLRRRLSDRTRCRKDSRRSGDTAPHRRSERYPYPGRRSAPLEPAWPRVTVRVHGLRVSLRYRQRLGHRAAGRDAGVHRLLRRSGCRFYERMGRRSLRNRGRPARPIAIFDR